VVAVPTVPVVPEVIGVLDISLFGSAAPLDICVIVLALVAHVPDGIPVANVKVVFAPSSFQRYDRRKESSRAYDWRKGN